eukprot:355412-Chlamydomonas_euryale.AAC.3
MRYKEHLLWALCEGCAPQSRISPQPCGAHFVVCAPTHCAHPTHLFSIPQDSSLCCTRRGGQQMDVATAQ